jgi:hypothetical protein
VLEASMMMVAVSHSLALTTVATGVEHPRGQIVDLLGK